MSEFSPLCGGNEGYGACDDDKQEKALALLWRLGGHFRPQCGQLRGFLCGCEVGSKTASGNHVCGHIPGMLRGMDKK